MGIKQLYDTYSLMALTSELVNSYFPLGTTYEHDEDIRTEWSIPNIIELRLVIKPDLKRSYIYLETDTFPGGYVDNLVTPSNLLGYINQFKEHLHYE